MPRTDKRVEDEFAVLVRRWLNQKRKSDLAREGPNNNELQNQIKAMKSTAKKMKKMLDGHRVLG